MFIAVADGALDLQFFDVVVELCSVLDLEELLAILFEL